MLTRVRSTLLLAVVLIGCRQAPNSRPGDPGSTSTPAADSVAAAREAVDTAVPVALFFGDSITAGYGLESANGFPALLQAKADSAGFDVHVVNAGNSGETSAGGLRRISWYLDNRIDLLLLELGANDGLRGVPLDDIRRNLQSIIDTVTARHPDALIAIAGMRTPPNMGEAYASGFHTLFPDLARRNDAILIPFLLEGVAGDTALNLADRIHPNERGHQIVAETVWHHLEPAFRSIDARGGASEQSEQ